MTEAILGSTEVCERHDIARSTLTQWLEKRWIIPFQRTGGGAYLFLESEVAGAPWVDRAKAEALAS
jgi:hypothetical protein